MSDTPQISQGGQEGSERALAVLGQALRDALKTATPEEVRRRVQVVLAAVPVQPEWLRLEMLGEYLDDLDAEYGPVPQELLDCAEREWPDFEKK